MRFLILFLFVSAPVLGSVRAQGEDEVKVDAETERIINRGLKYLAKYQAPNGSW